MKTEAKAMNILNAGILVALLGAAAADASAQSVSIDSTGKARVSLKAPALNVAAIGADADGGSADASIGWTRASVAAKIDKQTGQITGYRCGYKRGQDRMTRSAATPDACPIIIQ